jgi:predicted DCC family thiol-disulfide oxidoreductase YuxK
MLKDNNHTSVILFDGVCNFCNSSVNFIIRHDKKDQFRFTPLQSKSGNELLKKYNIDNSTIDSIVLIENNKAYIKSTAVLHIVKHLNRLYPLFYLFIIIPPVIRNGVYDFVARNRYKWFGKQAVCMIPSDEIKSKFIS